MERRFVIYEATPRWPNEILSGISAIPESELKRRLLMITGGDYREGDIDILLHGEKEQEAKPVVINRACPPTCKGIQPKEPNALDEWVKKMPSWLKVRVNPEDYISITDWLRAFPCKKCT